MDELCTACLCTGRNLYFIGETGSYHLYSQILNEIPVYDFSDVCVQVCWECRALLHRFRDFKALVKRSYSELLTQLHQNIPPHKLSLERAPRLRICAPETFAYPEVVKEEVAVEDDVIEHEEDVKPLKEEEPDINQYKYSDIEPEPFAEDIEIVKKSRKKRGTRKHEGDVSPLKEEEPDINQYSDIEPEPFAEDVEIVKKTRKKRGTRKTAKEKNKKVKSKKKLQEDEVSSNKKTDDTKSVSSEDSKLLNSEELPDVRLAEEEVQTERLKQQVVEVKAKRKRKEVTRSTENQEVSGDIVQIELEPTERRSQKSNGARSPKPKVVDEKPTCAECGKVFSSKKTYRYHLNVLHKGQNRYPCPRCGKVYQWKSNLGRHMRTHKARDSGELYCEMCDKRFASVATYRQHLRVSRRHVPEADFSFVCNECGKKFVNKTRLRDHIDWEHLHNIKFRCQLCNKPFKCHTSLYVHMQNVHKNKQKDNLCHICGKSYQNAAKLKYHIVAMHTSETPYRCAQCAAAFGWYSSLYRHVREVHYKMKLQPKKMRAAKRAAPPPAPAHAPHYAHA